MLFFFFLTPLIAISLTKPTSKLTCGYESCHPVKKNVINVHIVAHTHDDVGWVKTEEMYYNDEVKFIIDSVVSSLKKNKNRRFIYVETAFFWKWWLNQSNQTRKSVKELVNDGRLEFISGAWTMNDEATTNYQSIIDQFTWGLRKLNDTFGHCGRPKIGWQIDPFGHSREMALILAQLGFDGLLLGRIDYQDKENRLKHKNGEIVWKGSDDLRDSSDLFTGIMYNQYGPPPGFCFDIYCSDDEIVDKADELDEFDGYKRYNLNEKLEAFLSYVDEVAEHYSTNNIILTMGNDFNYEDAEKWFKNLDKLIYYGNKFNGTKYNIIYSTPSCYIKAVHDEAEKKGKVWKTKSDDYFPYASESNSYWTGYYTSRPTLKRFERVGNNYLQVCKQLYSLTKQEMKTEEKLNTLREAMGVMQHHDAISGTEKEFVAHDYAAQLAKGINDCSNITSDALRILMKLPKDIKFSSCLLNNISSCKISANSKEFIVTVYNPLSQHVNHFVRFPVKFEAYNVTDFKGKQMDIQMFPIPDYVKSIPGRKSKANIDLVFEATDIPPLGYKSFFIKTVKGNNTLRPVKSFIHKFDELELRRNKSTGLLSSVSFSNITIQLNQEFLFYEGFSSNSFSFNQYSGAYVFRPKKQSPNKIFKKVKSVVYHGSSVIEIQQKFNNWISQTIKLYKGQNFVEFNWVIGPIPFDEENGGKEVISRFITNLKSNGTFYTDSNGRQMMKRIKNYRPTWNFTTEEPVSSNYYPVTSTIAIRDESKNIEVAILTDRAEGGSSLNDGQIELMVHRNSLDDDNFGVNEPINEEAFGKGLVVKGSHFLVAGEIQGKNSISNHERYLVQKKLLAPWTFFMKTKEKSFEKFKKDATMIFSGLKKNLPENIQILTLEPWKDTSLLLRLEHILPKNSDLVKPEIVDIKELFHPFSITSIKETTLGGNQWLEENERLQFKTKKKSLPIKKKKEEKINVFNITMNPMEIRTFIIDVVFKSTSI